MNESEFRQLKTYDLVILTDREKVKAVLSENVTLPVPDVVICRVLEAAAPTASSPEIAVELRSAVRPKTRNVKFADHKKLNPEVKNRFTVGLEDISAAPSVDQLISSVDPAQITESDKLAIRFPARFIAIECGYRWLPSHKVEIVPAQAIRSLRTRSVRNRYQDKDLTESGGMRALLEYRSWITERLLEQVRNLTQHYATVQRLKQAATAKLDDESTKNYVDEIKTFEGDTPGSTQPTSDIDINTKGDGTEYAVGQFNSIFQKLHAGFEPGIVFDVNLYAKDFLPSFERWPDRTSGSAAQLIRPAFDHEFANYKIELEDADVQLTHAFIKLRRYMPETGWETFVKQFGDEHKLKPMLDIARRQHLSWAMDIAQSYRTNSEPQSEDVNAVNAAVATSGEAFLNSKEIDPAKLMKVQNRYYEHFLKTEVEGKRDKFNLSKFLKEQDVVLDPLYKDLRDAMSKSLYFANEAYVTAGAVLQVVGGKQKKSRGVEDVLHQKASLNNIAFTPHELVASAVDQLADIHKEANRHFAEKGMEKDVGGALLACGKYLHRLLNAVKHFYWLLLTTPSPDNYPSKGFPEAVFVSLVEWDCFRKIGFGLEALKKVKSMAVENHPSIMIILKTKFSATDQEATSLLNRAVELPSAKNALAEAAVMNLGKKFQKNGGKLILASTPNEGRPDPIGITAQDGFFVFFDQLVAAVLADYIKFYNSSKWIPFANVYVDPVVQQQRGAFLRLETIEEGDEDAVEDGVEDADGVDSTHGSISTPGSVSSETPIQAAPGLTDGLPPSEQKPAEGDQ